MSQEPAVYWSNYEQHKQQTEYEVRHKIAGSIEAFINMGIQRGLSEHFIGGLELAYSIAMGQTSEPPVEKAVDNENTLF